MAKHKHSPATAPVVVAPPTVVADSMDCYGPVPIAPPAPWTTDSTLDCYGPTPVLDSHTPPVVDSHVQAPTTRPLPRNKATSGTPTISGNALERFLAVGNPASGGYINRALRDNPGKVLSLGQVYNLSLIYAQQAQAAGGKPARDKGGCAQHLTWLVGHGVIIHHTTGGYSYTPASAVDSAIALYGGNAADQQ